MDSILNVVGAVLGSGIALGCLAAGFMFGYVVAVMRRAWKDYRTVKGSVPGLRRSAFRSMPRVFGWGAACALGLVLALVAMNAPDTGEPTVPAGVPSQPVSSPPR